MDPPGAGKMDTDPYKMRSGTPVAGTDDLDIGYAPKEKPNVAYGI